MLRIRFKSVSARNCLLWRKLDLSLEKEGLVLLAGANGAGKTSIGEILCDAFFGRSTKSGSGADILNWKAKTEGEGLYIEVKYALKTAETDDWRDFRLVKCRDWKPEGAKKKVPNGIFVYVDGEDDPISPARNTGGAQQKFAADHLHMTMEEFLAIVYLPHKMVHPLVIGIPATRMRYITDGYRLGVFDELLDGAKERLRQVKAKIEHSLLDAGRVAELRSQILEMRSEKELDLDKADAVRAQKLLLDDLREVTDKITILLRRLDGQRRRAKLEKRAYDIPESDRGTLRKQVAKLRKRRDTLTEVLPEVRRAAELKLTLASVKGNLKELSDAKLVDESQLKSAAKKLTLLRARLDSLKALQGLTDCPTCGQGLSGTHADPASLDDVQSEIKRLAKEHKRLVVQAEAYKGKLLVEKRIKEMELTIRDLPKIQMEKLRSEIQALDVELAAADKQMGEIVAWEALREELQALPKGKPETTESKLSELQQQKRKVDTKLQRTAAVLARILLDIENRARLKKRIEAVQSAETQLADFRQQQNDLELLVQAYGPKGLKRERTMEILKEIHVHLERYTGHLLPKYRFQLGGAGEEVEFEFTTKKGTEFFPVGRLSEGERKRLSLALLLAERDTRSVQTNLLFLDEYDGGLDENGWDTLTDTLSDLIKNGGFSTIFAISHNAHVVGHSAFGTRYRIVRTASETKLVSLGR